MLKSREVTPLDTVLVGTARRLACASPCVEEHVGLRLAPRVGWVGTRAYVAVAPREDHVVGLADLCTALVECDRAPRPSELVLRVDVVDSDPRFLAVSDFRGDGGGLLLGARDRQEASHCTAADARGVVRTRA